MKHTKKPNPDLPDIFAQLRAAEDYEVEVTAESYNVMVNVLAADPNALDLDEVQRVCLASGKSAADLERHVKLVRPLATGMARVAEEKIESAQAEIAEIGARREALTAKLDGKLPEEAIKREFEALSRRLTQAKGCVSTARKQLAEMELNQAALLAELRGEPAPAPVLHRTPAQPVVEMKANPTATKRPANYDQYDSRWRRVYDPKGNVFYEFNGKRVSA